MGSLWSNPSAESPTPLTVTEALAALEKKFGGKRPNLDETIIKECLLNTIFRANWYGSLVAARKKITVRVFLTAVSDNLGHQIGARILGARFGACHAGIQIDGMVLNWYNNSLVQIAPWGENSTCFMVFAPQTDVEFTLTQEVADKLAQVIIKWNSTIKHSVANANCQHFVIDVCKTVFGIDPFPKGLLGQRIKDLIRGDVNPSLHTKNAGILRFATHDELDAIERDLTLILSEEERAVLKVFHRAFQMTEKNNGITRKCALPTPPTGLDELHCLQAAEESEEESSVTDG